jgi:hypothetical protein
VLRERSNFGKPGAEFDFASLDAAAVRAEYDDAEARLAALRERGIERSVRFLLLWCSDGGGARGREWRAREREMAGVVRALCVGCAPCLSSPPLLSPYYIKKSPPPFQKLKTKKADAMLRKCQDEVAGLQAKRAQLENDRRQIGSVIGELDEKKRAALKDTWQKVCVGVGCVGGRVCLGGGGFVLCVF